MMPDVLAIFGQYGLPGLVCGALFLWIWRIDKSHATKIRELELSHAEERTSLQAQLKATHDAHKADLKEGNKNAIAILADVHEVVDRLGNYADSMAVGAEARGHGRDPNPRPRPR
jgi:hypothetical protein